VAAVCNELKNFSIPRCNTVIRTSILESCGAQDLLLLTYQHLSTVGTSIGCSGLIYIVVAVAGYYTYGTEVASDILVSYPQTKILSAARIFISLLVAFSYPLQCLPSRASATTLWASCDEVCSSSKLPAQSSGLSKPGSYSAVAADEEDQPSDLELEPQSEPGTKIQRGLSRPASPGSASDQEQDAGDTGDAAELVALTGSETVADVKEALQADSSARCRYITLTSIFLVGTLTVINSPYNQCGAQWCTLPRVHLEIFFVVLMDAYVGLQVALALADLGVLLSVVGASGSTIVSYILPGAIYYSIHTADDTWKRKAAACLFVAGCGIIPLALGFIFFGGASH
jgi:amino acid permease